MRLPFFHRGLVKICLLFLIFTFKSFAFLYGQSVEKFEKNDKIGLRQSEDKKVVIPATYEDIKLGNHNVFKVKQNGKWGYINYRNEKRGDFIFDEIEDYYKFKKGVFLARVKDKWGAVNKNGQIVFPINYDAIEPFFNNRNDIKLKVKIGRQWGIVNFNNPNNNNVKYDSIVKPSYLDVAVIYLNNKIGLLEYKNKIETEKANKKILIDEEHEVSANEDVFNNVALEEVIMDTKTEEQKGEEAEEIVSPIYDDLKVATSSISDLIYKETACDVKVGNNWGLISQSGDEIVPISASYVPKHLRIAIDGKNGKVGAVKNGEVVIPYEYNRMTKVSENAFIATKNKVKTIVNAKNEIIPIDFQDVKHLWGSHLIVIKRNDKWGYIDSEGEIVLPLIYDDAQCFSHNGIAGVGIDGKYGVINEKGVEIIPLEYDRIETYWLGFKKLNLLLVSKNGKKGYFNFKGEEKISAIYDKIQYQSPKKINILWAKKNGKYGFVSLENKIVIPFEYDEFDEFFYSDYDNKSGLIRLKKGAIWKLFSPDGLFLRND